MIIPSIDIQAGRAVQLRQGKEKVLDCGDPLELAERLSLYGEVAVVDLDAALGAGHNRDLIARICRIARCRVGGGLRTQADVRWAIESGASRVVIGTAATPEFLRQFPREWIIVALDARDGRVVTEGWTQSSAQTPEQAAERLEPYCSEFLFTLVEREGMMEGTNLEQIKQLRERVGIPLTAAGGITTTREIAALRQMEVHAQLGMAIYAGRLDLLSAVTASVDFEKGGGLVPTIVQEASTGQVLMLAYSSEASLLKALTERQGWYWSRSRGSLWRKGESSGHVQKLVRFATDCDGDALVFTVDQAGPACHVGSHSCFGPRAGDAVGDLYRLLSERVTAAPAGSYTAKLLADGELLKAKIREEAGEFAEFTDRHNLVHEAADLAYHALTLLAREGVAPQRVQQMLRSRGKREDGQ